MPLALFDARISVEIALPIARHAVLFIPAATFASTGKIVGLQGIGMAGRDRSTVRPRRVWA